MPSRTLLDQYAHAREIRAKAEETLKDAKAVLADAERALIDAMADEGTVSTGTDEFTVSVNRKLLASVTGDKETGCRILADDPSFGDITKVDVNLNTLSALIRERAEQHPDTDPMLLLPKAARDHFGVFEKYALNFRRK